MHCNAFIPLNHALPDCRFGYLGQSLGSPSTTKACPLAELSLSHLVYGPEIHLPCEAFVGVLPRYDVPEQP